MIELSTSTQQRLAALFPPEDLEEAGDLLARECAEDLQLGAAEGLERIRFAAIRLSGGRLERLRKSIQLARTDWRDLLMAAGFGHDVHAHETWRPRRLDREALEDWQKGGSLPGVELRFHDSVGLRPYPPRGKKGTVVALLALEPEPLYRIELGSRKEIEEYQRALKRSG